MNCWQKAECPLEAWAKHNKHGSPLMQHVFPCTYFDIGSTIVRLKPSSYVRKRHAQHDKRNANDLWDGSPRVMSKNVMNNTTSVTQTTTEFSDCTIYEKILYLNSYPDLNWPDDNFQIARHTCTTMNRSAPNHMDSSLKRTLHMSLPSYGLPHWGSYFTETDIFKSQQM